MARKVFFSFHHQEDSWRAGNVRNSWLGKGTENTFLDAAAWEKVKSKGDAAVRAWIDRELQGTTVTVVLIGKYTSERKWVRHEIEESRKRGNGLLGVYIHGVKDQHGNSYWLRGHNPLTDVTTKVKQSFFGLWDYEEDIPLSDMFSSYYWHDDEGRNNLPTWIEEAAVKAGK